MAGSDLDRPVDRRPPQHPVKKCPECFTYLPLDAVKCHDCGTRLEDVDWMGFAKRPIDWRGYLIAGVFVVIYCIFMWWAFFKD